MPRLMKMAQNNEEIDLLSAGKPLFLDTFGEYCGVFLDKYLANKTEY